MSCVGAFKGMLLQPELPSETEIDGPSPVLGQCLMASSQGLNYSSVLEHLTIAWTREDVS